MSRRRSAAVVALVLAAGCRKPAPAPAYRRLAPTELVWEARALALPPAALAVAAAGHTAVLYEIHSLAYRERFGVHFTFPTAGRYTLSILDAAQKPVGAAWTVEVGEAEHPQEREAERWLALHPEMTPDAQPRLMRALGESLADLLLLADPGPWRPETVAAAVRRFANHAARVPEMASNLEPPWAPARRPPPPDRERFLVHAQGLAADARALSLDALTLTAATLAQRLDALERDRCTRCHLDYRFAGVTRRNPPRGPAGVWLAPAASAPPLGEIGEAVNGASLYQLHCHSCHGSGPARGPAKALLETLPPNLFDPAFLYRRSDREIARAVLEGGEAMGRSRHMPAFGTTLGELEVWDLVAFLRGRTANPLLGLASYEELAWGEALPLPPDAPDGLFEVTVFRGHTAAGEVRLVASDPRGLVLQADATGKTLTRSGPGKGADDTLVEQAVAVATRQPPRPVDPK